MNTNKFRARRALFKLRINDVNNTPPNSSVKRGDKSESATPDTFKLRLLELTILFLEDCVWFVYFIRKCSLMIFKGIISDFERRLRDKTN